jgi:hypothetical protein
MISRVKMKISKVSLKKTGLLLGSIGSRTMRMMLRITLVTLTENRKIAKKNRIGI